MADQLTTLRGISKKLRERYMDTKKMLPDAPLHEAADALDAFIASMEAQPKPYAWHYWNKAGVSKFHTELSKSFDADMQTSIEYPNAHHCIPLYTHAQPSEPKAKKKGLFIDMIAELGGLDDEPKENTNEK